MGKLDNVFWVGLAMGFILGIVASVLAGGLREILASPLLGPKLVAGPFLRAPARNFSIWYVHVQLKAGTPWLLLASDLDALTAKAKFVPMSGQGSTLTFEPDWYDLGPEVKSARIGVGAAHRLCIATEQGGSSTLYPDTSGAAIFNGDYDLQLQLFGAGRELRRWLYKGAVAGGQGQQVSPTSY